MEKLHICISLFIILSSLICCSNPGDAGDIHINSNIVKVVDCCGEESSNYVHSYIMADWRENKLFGLTGLFQIITLDNNYKIIADTIYVDDKYVKSWTFIESNSTGDRFLLIKSNYADVSSGSLYELNLHNGELVLLRDSNYNVSSADYWHGDENRIVYYSYGEPIGDRAGYYIYDKITQSDSLIFSYISPSGPGEMINGFDLHPNNNILLIGAVQASQLVGAPPKLIQYNFTKNIRDTIDIDFNYSFVRIGLWVRYNSNGTKILYCNYPSGIYSYTTNDDSEIGIIELPTLNRKILDVNTNPYDTKRSVQFAPNWSPDEQAIVYTSGRLTIEGARGFSSLYILKNIN